MTRVYEAADTTGPGTRVLLVGVGCFPDAKGARSNVPFVKDLTSIAPGILLFAQRVLTTWSNDFAAPLRSVDLLLSDPGQPSGAVWPGFGVLGEASPGAPLDNPTLSNIVKAMERWLADAGPQDTILALFCGHGFSKLDRYFLTGDFGSNPEDGWEQVIDLRALQAGLSQKPPRTQWIFWDCCADTPNESLDTFGNFGQPIIRPIPSKISAARDSFGDLAQFSMNSAKLGHEAYGFPEQPSPFVNMLVDAIDGAGAIQKHKGDWWVDWAGLSDAVNTFTRRHSHLDDLEHYPCSLPSTVDGPPTTPLRRLSESPRSTIIARSEPLPHTLKGARIFIASSSGIVEFDQHPPQERAVVRVSVPARQHYDVIAVPGGGDLNKHNALREKSYAQLPLAEEVTFWLP